MYLPHRFFTPPAKPDVKIWRYIDFTKFVDMLSRKALYFPDATKLGDPFEGSFPQANRDPNLYAQALAQRLKPGPGQTFPPEDPFWACQQSVAEMDANFRDFIRDIRQFVHVNCWHVNDHESDAMWRLYLRSNEGVAIQSTFQRLCGSLAGVNEVVHIGLVKYIDFASAREIVFYDDLYGPFLLKRKSYEHENELRALISKIPGADAGEYNVWLRREREAGEPEFCPHVPVDLATLVEEIRVPPRAPSWFLELVKSVSDKYELDKPVRRSNLDTDPVW